MARQVNREDAACTRDVAHSQNSVVGLDVAPADGQSEPDTCSIHAALRKRQEQLFVAAGRQAAALIRDLDHDAITG